MIGLRGLATVFLLWNCYFISHGHSNDITDAFNSNKVFPDVLDESAIDKLKVIYGDQEIKPGITMMQGKVKDAPSITWDADNEAFYTLVMHDLDAPSAADPVSAEYRHWLVVNIPGCDVTTGDELAPYAGPSPPSGSGLHRYVLFVFKQSNGKQQFEGVSSENRPNQNLRDFVKKWTLGEPVAGDFFKVKG